MLRSFRNLPIGILMLGIVALVWFQPPAAYAAGSAPDTFTAKSYSDLPANAMSAAAYGNNVYIAVGYYGAIIKSADAETWENVKTSADINYTGVTNPSSFTFNGAAFGKGLFVVTGSEGVILTSPDGISWTQRTSNVTTGISSVEFLEFNGSSAFYATTQGKFLTSADGISWTAIAPTGIDSTAYITRVTAGNNGTRLGVGASNGKIYSTTNGTTWTSAQPSSASSGLSTGTNMLTWMNDRYYISDPSAYIWTSTDLSTFTLLGAPFKQNSSQYGNQMFNGFYDGTRYFLFGYQSPSYGAVYTSTNGTDWTMQTFKSQFVTQFSSYLNGKYFRLGNEGLQVSSDGSDWSFKWGGAYYEVIHDGSKYIAVGKEGNDGAIWTSGDLASWNKIPLPARSGIFTAAAYGNNKYVAIGENNQTTTTLATSNDGSVWTQRSSINDSTSLTDIAFGNGKFVAVGSIGSTVPKIKTSADGVTWSEPALPAQAIDALYSVTYANNQFIALGYGYDNSGNVDAVSIWTSSDGETWVDWSSSYPNTTDILSNIVYDGSKYILTGYDSTTYEVFSRTSDDLSAWAAPVLTGTYGYYGATTLMGQKGNNLYMVAYDSDYIPNVYYTDNQGASWQEAGIDFSSVDPNRIYGLMTVDGEVIVSGDSQLVLTTKSDLAQVDAPTASLAGGAVASGTAVELSSPASGAAIYYTLDGSTPTSSSTLYTGAITLTEDTTIKAIAVKAGMTDSSMLSTSYTIMAQVDAPTASPVGGAVASGTSVELSSSTNGAAIYYTLDGSTPTSSSTLYTGAIVLTEDTTIKAIAVKAGMTNSSVLSTSYTIMAQVDAPTASPAGGAVASGTAVELSSSTNGAAIYYTLDGSTPTSSSTLYTGAIAVTEDTTIKAIAVKAGMTDSSMLSTSYTIMAQVDAPTASPSGGAVASGTEVELSSPTSGAAIYYTLDGSTPTSSSALYTGAITLTEDTTIKAIAVKTGMTDSSVLSTSYTIMAQVDAPTANPSGGAVASGTEVELSSPTSGAAIYYTLDGSTPTSSSTLYTGAIPITSATTIKAIAVKAGMTDSSVLSTSYTILAASDSVINPQSIGFDKNVENREDVAVTVTLNGNTLASLSNGVAYLAVGADYTVSGSTVTIKQEYLATLPEGETNLTFNFSGGAPQTLEISVSDTTVQIPGVPSLTSAIAGNSEITLLWSAVEGSTGYKVYQRLSSTGYGSEVATVSGSVYSYTITGLDNGTTYYFVVKAANADGDSPASNEMSTTPRTTPEAPQDVKAAAGNGQAVISFTAPADNGGSDITGYEVTVSPGNVVVYGTASPITVTGLVNGTSYTFTVKAVNGAGSSSASIPSNAVTPRAPSTGGGTTTTPVITEPVADNGFNIYVNGKIENAGTLVTSVVNGQTVTTVLVDAQKLDERLAAEGQGAVITIPVTTGSDVVIAELTGQMIKKLEQKQAILEFKSADATYTLPAVQIDIDALSAQFGTAAALDNIKFQIEISAPSAAMMSVVDKSAAAGGFTLVAPPLNFVVRVQYGDTSIELTKFKAYVERLIALPDGVDPNRITTGIVVEPDGTVRHVPTRVVSIDQKYYASVKSLTNSTYSIVWHPLEFKDMNGHWAQEIVNNMGSRMIIDGTGNGLFTPDADITRAEFAAILVRGLGLKLENSGAPFTDVTASDWYSSAVETAYNYNLINGFEDGSFRPLDRITREQAMTMIAKAMKLTALKDQLPAKAAAELLSPFTDAGNVSAWALSSAADSIEAGIVSGRNADTLAPQAYVTRAEVAAMVQRLLQLSKLI